MTTRHDLPGGQWADLLDPDDLSGADQDAFFDEYDRLIQELPQVKPEPDPANPAVLLPAPPRTLGRAGNRALLDWLLARAITGWSLELDLPYRPGYRTDKGDDGKPLMPLRLSNALVKAAQPVQDALIDAEDEDGAEGAPKSAVPGGIGGSTGTSGGSTPSLLPAPPAVPSSTP